MKAYVIKSWRASDTSDANGNHVHIVGRTGGLISWLLNLVGISPTVELVATADLVSFKEGSWGGLVRYHTPLQNVCATFYGYTKPWLSALLLGLFLAAATFFLLGIPGLIVGIIYYYLNKTLTVGFSDMGGRVSHINFKRSVIEGQKIDEGAAMEVCRIIQRLVEERSGMQPSGPSIGTQELVETSETPEPTEEPAAPAEAQSTPPGTAAGQGGVTNYFYADVQSQPKGPYSLEQLSALEASGEITADTFVIVEGASEWKTWGVVKAENQS